MRKIDWEGDAPLSEEDIRFIVQAGVPGWIERAERHQARFDKALETPDVPEDTVTQSALDPEARAKGEPVPSDGAPRLVDPTAQGEVEPNSEDVEGDDYETWGKPELEAEVKGRNDMPDTTEVTVIGTGRDGNVLKADLIKGLRLWDNENPDAVFPDNA